mmetsp:Transcript_96610/g.312019  ORF Transcript_96610/g.312019 Transcript_96610/m.312019 type:complete len:304 (+) Transcript_96610:742-1653(+)
MELTSARARAVCLRALPHGSRPPQPKPRRSKRPGRPRSAGARGHVPSFVHSDRSPKSRVAARAPPVALGSAQSRLLGFRVHRRLGVMRPTRLRLVLAGCAASSSSALASHGRGWAVQGLRQRAATSWALTTRRPMTLRHRFPPQQGVPWRRCHPPLGRHLAVRVGTDKPTASLALHQHHPRWPQASPLARARQWHLTPSRPRLPRNPSWQPACCRCRWPAHTPASCTRACLACRPPHRATLLSPMACRAPAPWIALGSPRRSPGAAHRLAKATSSQTSAGASVSISTLSRHFARYQRMPSGRS